VPGERTLALTATEVTAEVGPFEPFKCPLLGVMLSQLCELMAVQLMGVEQLAVVESTSS
jgi:hypothetical protein